MIVFLTVLTVIISIIAAMFLIESIAIHFLDSVDDDKDWNKYE